MFCFHLWDKLSTTLLCIYAMLLTITLLSMHVIHFLLFDYYSCFSMVIKFHCLIISIMLMLGFYDSSYVCFYT
jgi:hypothetical protein